MAYEIEITLGNRTYHYATLEAYRDDMYKRDCRIRALNINFIKAQNTERKAELSQMLVEEVAEQAAIMKASYETMTAAYGAFVEHAAREMLDT